MIKRSFSDEAVAAVTGVLSRLLGYRLNETRTLDGWAREVLRAAEPHMHGNCPPADAVRDVVELAEEAIPYAADYFREKWKLDERLEELKKALPHHLPRTLPKA